MMQEPPWKRPRLTPHEPDYIAAAKGRGVAPKSVPHFGDLLVGDFASGKSSAARVSWLLYRRWWETNIEHYTIA